MRTFAISSFDILAQPRVSLRALAYDAGGLKARRLARASALRARAAKLIHDAEAVEALAASNAPPQPGENV